MPEKPLAVGKSWTSKSKGFVGPAAQMELNATYRFLGIKVNKEGAKLAEVAMRAESAPDKGAITASTKGTVWLLVSDGSMHSASLSQTVRIVLQGQKQPMTARQTIRVERRKAP